MSDAVHEEVLNNRKTCGLIMPISSIDGCSAEHWAEVKSIIQEALKDTEFDVDLVSNANEVGVIQQRIVTNVYTSDIVVCDVSAKNPNVMFELGMRLAFDKPTIIIKDDKTNYSFDTSPIEHLEYPRDLHYHNIQRFKEFLRAKVLATYKKSTNNDYVSFLKNFGAFTVAKVEAREVSSEEFILQSMKELRGEISSLAQSMRLGMNWSDSEQVNLIAFGVGNKEAHFLLSSLSDELLSSIADGNNADSETIFRQLLRKTFPSIKKVSPVLEEQMRLRFGELIRKEINNRTARHLSNVPGLG